MTNLYEITGNLLAAFVVGLLAYLAPWVKAWFLANTDAATQRRLQLLVQSFARAAEQLYPTRTRRVRGASSLSRISCGRWAWRSRRRSST